MALESATYINDLNASNPASSDSLKEADDHLRLVKQVIKNTFPNITGPVTAAQGALNSPFPVGGIIMWSGSIASIPSGWTLCNGTAVTRSDGSGTITPPDLRNRFIVGAGDTYAVAATGGATSVTLATANLPSHNHTVSVSGSTGAAGSHSHGVSDPGHSHSIGLFGSYQSSVGTGLNGNTQRYGADTGSTSSSGTGISIAAVGDHTHSLSISASIGNTGSGTAFSTLPPYYALAYIMKI
jgi:microcystin-dependent protein